MLGEDSDLVSGDESEHFSAESCESDTEDGDSLTPNAIDDTTAAIANPVVLLNGHTSQEATNRTSMEQQPVTCTSGGRSGGDEGLRLSARDRNNLRKGASQILSAGKEPVVGSVTGSLRIKADPIGASLHTVCTGNLVKSTTTDDIRPHAPEQLDHQSSEHTLEVNGEDLTTAKC